MQNKLEPSWKNILDKELCKSYFKKLSKEIGLLYDTEVVYPTRENIFTAFKLCPFEQVKVVILGQDPYHGEGQAQGLSFSVPDGVRIPPSLQNIYQEIKNDLGIERAKSGNLERWANQGVLLLNATLTVTKEKPGSHQGIGWEEFTDAVIETISAQKEHVVFLLWGNFARLKASHIDPSKHLLLEAPHPSPLSARRGFFGCAHFSQTNAYLRKNNLKEILW
ncbi:uracil-DNA glycosylase [Candidatus Kaiserbacteria bacterium]|nr:uracil-DNA glycosylase [Candidatus Kaiserbacteria bacterium]NCT02199.1 uracil-DNA glycosylase [Candidatus Parcubacteria bacterium]